MSKQKAIDLLKERLELIKTDYPELQDYKEALEIAINCMEKERTGITVKELKEMTLDTSIVVRNHNTGEFFRNFTECENKNVCKMYAKITKCSRGTRYKADLVVFAK